MTWKKNPASMGGGGDFPREFGMWFGGAGRAGHPATSRGASILKKSRKERVLNIITGEARKKAIAKLAKEEAKKKASEKTHDTLGRKIYRGKERKKHGSMKKAFMKAKQEEKAKQEAAKVEARTEWIKRNKEVLKKAKQEAKYESIRVNRAKVEAKRQLRKKTEKKIKVQKIPEGKSSSQAEATGKKITTKEEAKRIRKYIKTQKMLDDYTN